MATYGEDLRALHPIIDPLFQCIADGLEESQAYHTDRLYRRSDDPHYYLHTVRRHACRALTEMGLHARQVDEGGALNMSGILIYYRDLAVRVLHTQRNGKGEVEVPVAGRSLRRQAFWRQVPTLPEMSTENVLMLWLDKDGAVEDPMIMVRPLGGDHQRSSLRLEWKGKVSRGMALWRAEDLVDLQPDWRVERLA